MDKKKMPDDAAEPSVDKSSPSSPESTRPMPAPNSDPTNPHNQEPVGDWIANERASERRNTEPGFTDEERKQRRW